MPFEFATAQRIIFGAGSSTDVPHIAAALGSRPLLVCGSRPERLPGHLRGIAAETLTASGEPTFDAVRTGLRAAQAARADVILAVGGGSVIDFAKALAMLLANGGDPMDYAEVVGAGRVITRASLPLIALPTTAGAGSEVTRNAVLRDPVAGMKASLRSPLMLPAVALVDPLLTGDLPPALTASTGLDALTQLIEPFLSVKASPMTDALCREGLPRVVSALPRAFRDGADAEARSEMSLGAMFGGLALANAGLGAVHGFAAAIGGSFDAPHGAVCAALLAPVLSANAARMLAEPQRQRLGELARLLLGRDGARAEDLPAFVRTLTGSLGIPGLRAYGLAEAHVEGLCARAAASSSMRGNPVPLPPDALAEILCAAL